MLAMLARVVPHIIRACRSLPRGATMTLLPSTLVSTCSVSFILLSLSRPLATSSFPAIDTCTPCGSSTGYLPTRDIAVSSEHPAEHFAAHVGRPRLVIAQHAARRGEDRYAEARIDARQLAELRIDAPAGLGDAVDLFDHWLALVVFEFDPKLGDARPQLLGREAADITLTLQHIEHVRAQLRSRRDAGGVARALRIADAGEHVTQRVRHGHGGAPFLPACLGHAGDLARRGQLAQHVPAELELAVIAARAAGQLAAQPHPHLRAVTRKLGKFERRLEAVLHRTRTIHHDRLQRGALGLVTRGHARAHLVAVDLRGLGHAVFSTLRNLRHSVRHRTPQFSQT